MKRWTFIILLFLLLVSGGAVVNVAVAVLSLMFCELDTYAGRSSSFSAAEYAWLDAHGFVVPEGSFADRWKSFGMRADTYFDLGVAGDDRTKIEFVYRLRAGWPLLALYGDCWDVVVWDDTSQDYVESHTEHEWAVPFEAESKQFANVDPIPLGIVWWGFLIDTLLFAGLLWLPIRGPFVLRRHIRLKHGRCPKCGYDLRGKHDAGCPECGWNRTSEQAPGGDVV